MIVLSEAEIGPPATRSARDNQEITEAARLSGCQVYYGYYWDGEDALAMLTSTEEAVVMALAEEAARRVGTPFLCTDVGQTDDGAWTVIEVGDAQFAGVGHAPLLPLWQRLMAAVVAV